MSVANTVVWFINKPNKECVWRLRVVLGSGPWRKLTLEISIMVMVRVRSRIRIRVRVRVVLNSAKRE